jgi:hypothetical protein
MKTTTLLMDHYKNTDKGVVVYKAGTTVTLPDDEVDYIHSAVIAKRRMYRKVAATKPGFPEYERAR